MAKSDKEKQQGVEMASLSMEQLSQYNKQLTDEIENFSTSYQHLKAARERFHESKRCLEALKGFETDGQLLVPLTSSMYVEGTFGDLSTVIVDVGTGYFIRQSVPKAQDFTDRKMAMLKENMDELAKVVQMKQKQQDAIVRTMQEKIAEERARKST
eukprot:NODE_1685_length_562_cov_145.129841_g1671_i0.p1 GENE.NODE_1685_length_562_cov_145.129841_g1671_i0~~NODE_1685_length_562_cov_145.129841_g1671_i0.p1  ORF type:complete len:172 (-),score=36.54 NODE_1685_length_562_cov_145.129841_g1671_i0:45-512(-)